MVKHKGSRKLRDLEQLKASGKSYSWFRQAKCPQCGLYTSTEYIECRHCPFNVAHYYDPPKRIITHVYTRTAEERIYDDYSPEEVMSGVPFGGDLKTSPFKKESNKDWRQESAEQVQYAESVLSSV